MSVLSIAAVVAAAALAKPGLYNDGTPPERFRHDATITVQLTDQPSIDRHCQALFGKPPRGSKTNACYTGAKAIMPNPCSFPATDAYAHMLCHELGHANGWPSTHGP